MNRRTVWTTGPILERGQTKATIQRVLLGILGTLYIPSPPTMVSWWWLRIWTNCELCVTTMPARRHSLVPFPPSHSELTVILLLSILVFYLDAVNFATIRCSICEKKNRVWYFGIIGASCMPGLWLLNKSGVAGTSSHCISSSFPPDDSVSSPRQFHTAKPKAKAQSETIWSLFPGKERWESAIGRTKQLEPACTELAAAPCAGHVQFLVIDALGCENENWWMMHAVQQLKSIDWPGRTDGTISRHFVRVARSCRLVILLRCRKLLAD